ncbi:MAG: hypothetical protein HRU15_20660, partial [Planctomycetes bacterium]|nr:hypothetical protein [Planctomycetota bacterium]
GGRPGYEEWHGTHGTIQHQPIADRPFDGTQMVFPYDQDGRALSPAPVERQLQGSCLQQIRCQLPNGLLQFDNPFYTRARIGWVHATYWYASAVIAHLHDFAVAVQHKTKPQMTDELSLATVCMENAVAASIADGGKQITLSDFDGSALEEQQLKTWEAELGYNPSDIEAVVDSGRNLRR